MQQKYFLLIHIFAILILLKSGQSFSQNYIKNAFFESTTCPSIGTDYSICQNISIAQPWQATQMKELSLVTEPKKTPFSIQESSKYFFIRESPFKPQRIVPLDFYNKSLIYKHQRICIQQKLSTDLDLGKYFISFKAATRTNETNATNYRFYDYYLQVDNILYNGTKPSKIIKIVSENLTWDYYGIMRINVIFDITSQNTLNSSSDAGDYSLIRICSRPAVKQNNLYNTSTGYPRATAVTNISLIKLPDVDLTKQRGPNQEIIINGKFKYTNCIDRLGKFHTCRGQNILWGWKATNIDDVTPVSFAVMNNSGFYGSSEFINKVSLDLLDQVTKEYHRICLIQEIGMLVRGVYTLKLDAQEQVYPLSNFSILITNSDGSQVIFRRKRYATNRLMGGSFKVYVANDSPSMVLRLCSQKVDMEELKGYIQHNMTTAAVIYSVSMKRSPQLEQDFVTVLFNTGQQSFVEKSVVQQNPTCIVFQQDPQSDLGAKCSPTNDCLNKRIMNLQDGKLACPKVSQPSYWIDQCGTYKFLGQENYQCIQCVAYGGDIYTLGTTTSGSKRCFVQIDKCMVYNDDGTCNSCQGGIVYYDEEGRLVCDMNKLFIDDGRIDYVSGQKLASLPECQVYSYDSSSTPQYSCGKCKYQPMMKLSPSGYACFGGNPHMKQYFDYNCETYTHLGFYDYNCTSCKDQLVLTKPSGLDYNKCFTPIPDCIQYGPIGNCDRKAQKQEPVPQQTPLIFQRYFTDGQLRNIPEQVIYDNPGCLIFQANPYLIDGNYICFQDGCMYKGLMALSTHELVCPTENYQTYWDDKCLVYQKDPQFKYNCIECAQYDNYEVVIAVKPEGMDTNRCLVQIEYCLKYDKDNNCLQCQPWTTRMTQNTPQNCLISPNHHNKVSNVQSSHHYLTYRVFHKAQPYNGLKSQSQ